MRVAGAFKLFGLSVALVLLALAAGDSTQIGLAQAGTVVTVCASGCNFATIQAAIDAASGGSTIQVQAGTYQENLTIRNKDGLTLKGAGQDQVTLDGNGPQQKNTTPGILILSSNNITVTGFKITNSRRGLQADDTTHLFVEANEFDKNLRAGIRLLRSEVQIKSNLIQGTQLDLDESGGVGIILLGSQAVLNDNTITGNADCGFISELSAGQTSQASGGNNTIQNNKMGDLCGNAPTTLLAQPPAEGTLDTVAVPTDAATIQEAVNKVKAGGTITVAAGTYKEQVQIYKSVTIRGTDPDQTILQALGTEYVVLNIATDQLQVTLEGLKVTGGRRGAQIATGPAGNVTLRNVKLDGNGAGHQYSDAGLWIYEQPTVTLDQVSASNNQGLGIVTFDQAKVTIQKSTISDNQKPGIGAYGNSRVTLEENTIARNAVQGAFTTDSAQATITNNQIINNKALSNGGGQGIGLFGSSRATTISGNTLTGNVIGIGVYDQTQATMMSNTISNNSLRGIELLGSAQATISKNTIMNDNDGGILAGVNARLTVDDNTITRNSTTGIWLENSAEATITNNRITDNKLNAKGQADGIRVDDDSRATILNNTISGNARWGVMLLKRAKATITNNTIANNISDGILIGAPVVQNEIVQAEISSNKIQNNKNCGITTDNDPGIKITGQGNTISGNTKGQLCGTTNKFPAGFGGGK